jgi:hypothetical protein
LGIVPSGFVVLSLLFLHFWAGFSYAAASRLDHGLSGQGGETDLRHKLKPRRKNSVLLAEWRSLDGFERFTAALEALRHPKRRADLGPLC